jgi:hypothetical protein
VREEFHEPNVHKTKKFINPEEGEEKQKQLL